MKSLSYLIGVLIPLGLLLFVTSCDDAFSTTIDIDPPPVEKQLVFTAFIKNDNEEIYMYVGTNFGILDDVSRNDFKLPNAKVTITRSTTSEQYDTDQHGEYDGMRSGYNYILRNYPIDFFVGGETYTFKVEHPDFATSETTLVFPKLGELDIVSYKYEDGIDEEGDDASSITIDLTDDLNEVNYYEIELRTIRSDNPADKGYNFWIFSPDPAVSKGVENDNIFISDESFNGQKKRLTIKFDRDLYTPDLDHKLIINWRAVNEGYYSYSKTLSRASDNQDNPFGSPTQVYSNVNNALGAIGLRSEATMTVDE